MERRRRRRLIIGAAILAVLVAGFGIAKAMGSKKPLDPEKLATVEQGDIARSVVATGKIEPPPRSSQVEGQRHRQAAVRRLRRPGEEGPGAGRARQGRAAGAAARSRGRRCSRRKAALERNRVEAEGPDLPFLKAAQARAQKLFGEGLISDSVLEDAEKAYQMALNKQSMARRGVAVNQAEVARAQAALERARERPAQLDHREPDGRPGAVARRRGGRRRQLDPGAGLGGDARS